LTSLAACNISGAIALSPAAAPDTHVRAQPDGRMAIFIAAHSSLDFDRAGRLFCSPNAFAIAAR